MKAKRVLSLLLSGMMTAGMSVSAFADGATVPAPVTLVPNTTELDWTDSRRATQRQLDFTVLNESGEDITEESDFRKGIKFNDEDGKWYLYADVMPEDNNNLYEGSYHEECIVNLNIDISLGTSNFYFSESKSIEDQLKEAVVVTVTDDSGYTAVVDSDEEKVYIKGSDGTVIEEKEYSIGLQDNRESAVRTVTVEIGDFNEEPNH